MPITAPTITIEEYTAATGTGVFDLMMVSVADIINKEYKNGRIKGVEYSTVLLGALQSTQDKALAFLLSREKTIQEVLLVDAQLRKVEADILVSVAQECKLRAEFDLITVQIPKVVAETGVLQQKKVTETAQTNGAAVAADSVIGKQLTLYNNQAEAFLRDAEQKAAKIMADTWNVRRTTDETGTDADANNKLSDNNVGGFIQALMDGVGATETPIVVPPVPAP